MTPWLYRPIFDSSYIPRATRMCFTLYERKDGVDTPLAWVNCMLFDYKHELKTGVHTLGMWPDAAANPIGTCVSNSASAAVVLFVEFESYSLPVVFPTEPATTGIFHSLHNTRHIPALLVLIYFPQQNTTHQQLPRTKTQPC